MAAAMPSLALLLFLIASSATALPAITCSYLRPDVGSFPAWGKYTDLNSAGLALLFSARDTRTQYVCGFPGSSSFTSCREFITKVEDFFLKYKDKDGRTAPKLAFSPVGLLAIANSAPNMVIPGTGSNPVNNLGPFSVDHVTHPFRRSAMMNAYNSAGQWVADANRLALGIAARGTDGIVVGCFNWDNFLTWVANCDTTGFVSASNPPPTTGPKEYIDLSSNTRPCKPTTTCKAGEQGIRAALWSTDRVCTACPVGKYKPGAGNGYCVNARTKCPTNRYISKEATTTSDIACSICAVCGPKWKTWEQEPCGIAKNTKCTAWTKCSKGTYSIWSTDSKKDSTCLPCDNVSYMDQDKHYNPACKKLTLSCQPGQRQSRAPWVDHDRECAPCPAGTYQDKAGTSAVCKDVTVCFEPLTESQAPTSTSDRKCVFTGAELPTAMCPPAAGVGVVGTSEQAVSVPMAVSDFVADHRSDGVELSLQWQRSDAVGEVVSNAVEAEKLLARPVSTGTLVTVTFTVTVTSQPALTTSCTTIMHVLRAGTTHVLEVNAARNASYLHPAVEILLEGDYGDTVFEVQSNLLPAGMHLEMTTALAAPSGVNDASGNTRLRLLGAPQAVGRFAFNVTARSVETDAVSVVNLRAFQLDVRACDDSYATCVNGRCTESDSNPFDEDFSCTCTSDFEADSATGLCTEPAIPLLLTCPCNLQLAAIRTDAVQLPSWMLPMSSDTAAQHMWLTEGQGPFLASGLLGGLSRFWLEDAAGNVLSTQSDLPSGAITTIRASVADGRTRTATCSLQVGVLRVWSKTLDATRNTSSTASPSESTPASEISPLDPAVLRQQAAQRQKTAEPIRIALEWAGNLASHGIDFSIENMTNLASQGFEANVTSAYDVVQLPNGNSDERTTTIEFFVANTFGGTRPRSGRYIFRVLASVLPLPGTLLEENCRPLPSDLKRSLEGAGSGRRRRQEGISSVYSLGSLPPGEVLAYGDEQSQNLTLAVEARPLQLDVVDCLDTNGYVSCGEGGRCNDDAGDMMFDGQPNCDCSGSILEQDEAGFCSNVPEASAVAAAADKTGSFAAISIVALLALAGLVALVVIRRRRNRLRKYYHIFISYRVATDAALAKSLCAALQESRRYLPLTAGESVTVRCFFDQQNLKKGKDWREGFLNGLERSCLFLPIVSEAAVAPIKEVSANDSKDDNVLLEYETALRLKAARRLVILPLLVGATHAAEYNFGDFGPHVFPDEPSRTCSKGTISHTMTDLLRCQGLKLCHFDTSGIESGSLDTKMVKGIVDALQEVAWGAPARRNRGSVLHAGAPSTLDRSTDAVKADVDCLQLWRYYVRTDEEEEDELDNVDLLYPDSDADVDGAVATSRESYQGSTPSTMASASHFADKRGGTDGRAMLMTNPLYTETEPEITSEEPEGFGNWSAQAENESHDASTLTLGRPNSYLIVDAEPTAEVETDGFVGAYTDMQPIDNQAGMSAAPPAPNFAARSGPPVGAAWQAVAETSQADAPEEATWHAAVELTRAEAERTLQFQSPGAFLVRDKSKNTSALSVVRQNGRIEHHLLRKSTANGWLFNETAVQPPCHGTLVDFITRLQTNESGNVLKAPLTFGAYSDNALDV